MAVALSIGMAGYHFIAGLSWIDALMNASMILTGMGPVDVLRSNAAKVFASLYALFSGVVFISLMGLLLSPIARRVLHKFHLSDDNTNDKKSRKAAGSRDERTRERITSSESLPASSMISLTSARTFWEVPFHSCSLASSVWAMLP